MSRQTTNTVLMVRPANFGFNTETADNNAFQKDDGTLTDSQIREHARDEFDSMVAVLEEAKIEVIVIEDTEIPIKTDAVFPNNWFTTHQSGAVILYPMYSPNRRLERRNDIVELLSANYEVNDVSDYLEFEKAGIYVEGTGSMILDRIHKKIYVCRSERSHQILLEKIANDFKYELISFAAFDATGVPYYHTNVIMTLGQELAIICLESVEDEIESSKLINSLTKDGIEIVDISREQVTKFAGNMLELDNKKGETFMVMSSSAFKSLTPSQILTIESSARILHSPLPIIEKYGGGSARCMMAEIFLEKNIHV